LGSLTQEGTYRWRRGNKVVHGDALTFLLSEAARRADCIYADPPYTKDHYSRYYHVYETLYRYDFPDSIGAGRYRSDRFSTEFCYKSKVADAFERMAKHCADLRLPLVLSYPAEGLLGKAGTQARELLASHYRSVNVLSLGHAHSTLGASDGRQKKQTVECIY